MCTSVPARVLRIDGREADLISLGRTARATVATDAPVRAGDWVLVQAGLVLEVLGEEEALGMMRALEEWMAWMEAPEEAGSGGGDAS